MCGEYRKAENEMETKEYCRTCGDTPEHHGPLSICLYDSIHSFRTDAEYRAAVDMLYDEWRNRPSETSSATVDFDEWKVAEIMRMRRERRKP